ncbi:acetyltransferase [Vibrio cholerae]|nr:acetyltransferase [Vibrio cholerae]
MVTAVVFEFCVMRCQPLRRALCKKAANYCCLKIYYFEQLALTI